MLTHAHLGLVALAILWLNTVLVAWATLREAARIRGQVARFARLVLGVLAIVGGAAACTALALRPPVFGAVSTAGGVAGLAFFLLVQPLGTALRDHARAGRPQSGG